MSQVLVPIPAWRVEVGGKPGPFGILDLFGPNEAGFCLRENLDAWGLELTLGDARTIGNLLPENTSA